MQILQVYFTLLLIINFVSSVFLDYREIQDQDLKCKCLDGSIAGYYIQEVENSQSYLLYVENSDICLDTQNEIDGLKKCYEWSLTDKGSTKSWPKQIEISEGIFADSHFNSFNKIYIKSCDGTNLLSQFEENKNITDDNGEHLLFFRGFYNLKHIIIDQDFRSKPNLHSVYVIGGITAFIISEKLQLVLTQKTQLYSILDNQLLFDFYNNPNLQNPLKNFYNLTLANKQNTNFNGGCPQLQQAEDQRWQCLITGNVIEEIDFPVFIAQSLVSEDSIQKNINISLSVVKNYSNISEQTLNLLYDYNKKLQLKLSKLYEKKEDTGGFLFACPVNGSLMMTNKFWNEKFVIQQFTLKDAIFHWIDYAKQYKKYSQYPYRNEKPQLKHIFEEENPDLLNNEKCQLIVNEKDKQKVNIDVNQQQDSDGEEVDDTEINSVLLQSHLSNQQNQIKLKQRSFK